MNMPETAPDWLVTALHRGVQAGMRLRHGGFDTPPSEGLGSPEAFRVAFRVEAGELSLGGLRWPGEGPPIVLLHGLDASPWMWGRVAAQLSPSREVIALALRGHGASDTPDDGYDLETSTRDVLRALETLSPEPFALAGHSWGGRIAMNVAATAPERVSALALADPVGPRGLSPLIQRFPVMMAAALAPERRRHASRDALDAAAREIVFLAAGDEADLRVWREMHRELPDGSWGPRLPESAFRSIIHEALVGDIRDRVAAITCPCLLLLPTFSVNVLPCDRRAYRRIPKLTVRKIAGDHSFIHSNARDTVTALREHLRLP